MRINFTNYDKLGGIPYTGHRAQITPAPNIFSPSCFYAYFRLGFPCMFR